MTAAEAVARPVIAFASGLGATMLLAVGPDIGRGPSWGVVALATGWALHFFVLWGLRWIDVDVKPLPVFQRRARWAAALAGFAVVALGAVFGKSWLLTALAMLPVSGLAWVFTRVWDPCWPSTPAEEAEQSPYDAGEMALMRAVVSHERRVSLTGRRGER